MLGHDLLNVAEAVSSETVVIAGPLTLLQSGDPVVNQALIARYPINIAGHRYAKPGGNKGAFTSTKVQILTHFLMQKYKY